MAVGALPSVNNQGSSGGGASPVSDRVNGGDLAGTTTSAVGATASGGSTGGGSTGNPNAQNIGPSTANPQSGGSSAAQSLVGMSASQAPSAQVGVNYNNVLQNLASQAGKSTYNPTGLTVSGGSSAPSGSTSQLVAAAKGWIGTPYEYGGTSRSGVDCSGFTQAVYQSMGLNIGRDTSAQLKSGQVVGTDGNWQADMQLLQPGDLIFYGQPGATGPNAHVAMYIGNGQVMQAAHTGTNVGISPLFSSAAPDEPFLGVRRYMSGSSGTGAVNTAPYTGGGNVPSWINQALAGTGQQSQASAWTNALNLIIGHESSGNPNAVNNWDSNAKAGHPSQGLMQLIPSNFAQYAPANVRGEGILNPVANIEAGIEYILARYGSPYNVPGVKSIMSGGGYVPY